MDFNRILEAVRKGQIEKILGNDNFTDFQKAADIHALMTEAVSPPGPKPERKARAVKPKPDDLPAHDEHQA